MRGVTEEEGSVDEVEAVLVFVDAACTVIEVDLELNPAVVGPELAERPYSDKEA